MHPTQFQYHRAASVDEAISLLDQFGPDAKILAGGHSLLPVMKLRLAEPSHLVDIGEIPSLRGIAAAPGGGIRIGAMTTHEQIARDPLAIRHAPPLAQASAQVGDRQVRNRGTIGGAIAHADSAADQPAAILALDASIVAHGPSGERVIPAGDFFTGFLSTALDPDEIVVAIDIPALPARSGGSYLKLANQASGYAVVGVAAVVSLDGNGRCASARIGVTGAVTPAARARRAEEALAGQALDAAAISAAATLTSDGLDILADLHASAEYRRRVLAGLAGRALRAAASAASA
ncbi:MAG: FAD binding domain-containing protein [Chloroflexota bacterium]